MGRNSIMGSRWSITPDEANNIAAENYLALLNIQGKFLFPDSLSSSFKCLEVHHQHLP